MKYRKFGSLDWEVSVLGFGASALAALETDAAGVALVRAAIDGGINYLDLASPAHECFADSCRRVRRALRGAYRERVRLAAHVPLSCPGGGADLASLVARQLKALGQDRVDFLILDGVDRDTWPALRAQDVLQQAAALRAAGSIGGLGFGFHEHRQFLREILEDGHQWDLCQFQYNYLYADSLPGLGGLRYAAERGPAVVAAEPLHGGRLAHRPPRQVAEIWAGAEHARSLAAWGLLWVWNHPEVATTVCAMNSPEQLREYLDLADGAQAGGLSIGEQVLIGRVRDAYRKLQPVPCAACRVCMPCAQDIDVPRILELYNDAVVFDDLETARVDYRREQHRLQDCNECGACADACGRMIAILDRLREARELLEDK